MKDCYSVNMLNRETCSGYCPSYESNYIKYPVLDESQRSCLCCRANETYVERVDMKCPKGIITADYVRIKSCKCIPCTI